MGDMALVKEVDSKPAREGTHSSKAGARALDRVVAGDSHRATGPQLPSHVKRSLGQGHNGVGRYCQDLP